MRVRVRVDIPLAMSGWHRDTDKVWFLKVPVSQTGLFVDAVENMAQRLLATLEQAEAVLSRRAAAACTVRWLQRPSLLVAKGGPLCPPPLLHRIRLQKRYLWAWRRQAAPPQRERELLREMVDAPLPPLEEGRVENLLFKKMSTRSSCFWVPRGHGNSQTGQHRTTRIPLSCQQATVSDSRASSKALLTHPLANWGTR